jgi:hypothetical protein
MRKMFVMILVGMAIGGTAWSVLAGETKARKKRKGMTRRLRWNGLKTR